MASEGYKGTPGSARTRKLITSASSDWVSRESLKARDMVNEPSLLPGLKDLIGTDRHYLKNTKTQDPPIPNYTQTLTNPA